MNRPSIVYLASQSPRRQELLRQIGVEFEPLVADSDEDAEALEVALPNETARHYVLRVAALKAGAAILRMRRRDLPPAPILAADTTVALGRKLLGKPADAGEARTMLRALSGTSHRVLTAVAVTEGARLDLAFSESRVDFRPISASEIDRYVASGEPLGKAGAYAIQGRASVFISRISGSHSGIVGLPLYETTLLLARYGLEI